MSSSTLQNHHHHQNNVNDISNSKISKIFAISISFNARHYNGHDDHHQWNDQRNKDWELLHTLEIEKNTPSVPF